MEMFVGIIIGIVVVILFLLFLATLGPCIAGAVLLGELTLIGAFMEGFGDGKVGRTRK